MNQTKYAELFASEAREHLAQIARSLVALESEPGDRESLDAIFRSAHTIKGMAAAMGYTVVTRLAHSFESALERIRGLESPVDAAVISNECKRNGGGNAKDNGGNVYSDHACGGQ